jgi:SPP1 family predicted phage head-tail adaptor
MNAGELRTIVYFQQQTETADGYGGKTVAWSTGAPVHCRFIATSGREQLKNGRLESSVTATLRVRTGSVVGVDESWRATIGGVSWNIRAVIPFGQRDEFKDLIIERGGSAGVAI